MARKTKADLERELAEACSLNESLTASLNSCRESNKAFTEGMDDLRASSASKESKLLNQVNDKQSHIETLTSVNRSMANDLTKWMKHSLVLGVVAAVLLVWASVATFIF